MQKLIWGSCSVSKVWTMKNKELFWSHLPKKQGSDKVLTPALYLF